MTDRAHGRHHERLRIGRTLLRHIGDHLGNHITGAPHDDGIADLDILAPHFIFVMQCRIRHRHAAHQHRCQACHRRNRPGTSDLHFYPLHCGQRFFCREFMRDREARCT
ncbi:hypothetical protein D3C81_1532270 [compost metagenome]